MAGFPDTELFENTSDRTFEGNELIEFTPTSNESVIKLIRSSPSKSCTLGYQHGC